MRGLYSEIYDQESREYWNLWVDGLVQVVVAPSIP